MATRTVMEFWARVAGWQNRRRVVVRDNEVAMEVAITSCRHCPTCASRVDHVQQTLQGKCSRVEYSGSGMYYVLPYAADRSRNPRDVASFLGNELRLGITI